MKFQPEMPTATKPPKAQRTPNRPPHPPQCPRPGDRRKRGSAYPDSQQLFVGNIPQSIDVNELMEFFSKYGNVMELRLNSRGDGGMLPNFGFVVFNNSVDVQIVLDEALEKPILFRGVNLNVQEKLPLALRRRQTRSRDDHRPNMRPNIMASGRTQGNKRDGDSRVKDRVVPYPDSQQLFVGNIPQAIEVKELMEFFSKYGNVVELQMNARGGMWPNFGFVVFNNSVDVQIVLDEALEKPILFRGVNLNVQKKLPLALRRQQTRSRDDHCPNMRPNHLGSGGTQGILGGTMHEHGGTITPQSGTTPLLRMSSDAGDKRDGDSGVKDRVFLYPDSHQLFVGNIPEDVDGNELFDFFNTYGNVVELRINTINADTNFPNYGFVVFDNPEDVQSILKGRPILFQGEVNLNVNKIRPSHHKKQTAPVEDHPIMKRNYEMLRLRYGRGPSP